MLRGTLPRWLCSTAVPLCAVKVPPAASTSTAQAPADDPVVEMNTEGGLVNAGSPVCDKYVRTQMYFNKVNNILFYSLIISPFVVFPYFFYTKVRPLLDLFKDPYAFPDGFDPNKDLSPTNRPPGAAEGSQKAQAPVGSMLVGSAPGAFHMKGKSAPADLEALQAGKGANSDRKGAV